MDLIIKFARDESGATAVEYAVVLAVISLGVMISFKSLVSAVARLFTVAVP
jgi:Flp pilus assembly pilin Flp